MQDKTDFILAIKGHDASIAQTGLAIWLDAEPTFTDRSSETPEWLYRAEGGGKSQRALAILKRLCQDRASPLVLRTLGRQYPGEKLPRWSFGIYESRNHSALWKRPPDPALGGVGSARQSLEDFPLELTCGVLDVDITRFHTKTQNSYRFTNRPITMSCIFSSLEKQIVFLASRLIRVRRVRCFRSIFCVFRLPTTC